MIHVSLGANTPSRVGEPLVTLRAAIAEMPAHGMEVIRVSPFYRSMAWPNPADPVFVNAAVTVRTARGPMEVLQALLAIERQFGRVRKTRWEPRCLDLDLIDYGGLILDTDVLSLPHPRLHERGFVLRPLMDLDPAWRHPDTGTPIAELLENAGEEGLSRLPVDQKNG
ncbi:MAG: 2-amino-4-hydroxy-6-hydroxymethyldihydropteridine diphosphokinase [Alphaproteobacteria bacterium]